MTTTTKRIAGLSVRGRPHHALVVLVREGEVWSIESVKTACADPVLAFENPQCPVVVDATAFWLSGGLGGATDADKLRAAGWEVRAPNHGSAEMAVRNPPRAAMQAHLDEMLESRRLKPSLMLGDGVLEALHLAAWGTREPAKAIDEVALDATRAIAGVINPTAAPRKVDDLLPHQRAVAEQLDAWLATDAPIAMVVGDRRSGKAHAVAAWAKATGLKVETITASYANSDEGMDELKQGKRDVTVVLDAGMVPRRVVADALYAGRVVLVVGAAALPDSYPWPHDLVAAVLHGGAPGAVIECKAPPREASPAVIKLLRVIDPTGAA